jgi:hypothetical protein
VEFAAIAGDASIIKHWGVSDGAHKCCGREL